jgi:chromosome partitioning protein
MGKVIAVANQKGGGGKTTTAVNVASSAAEAGHRVLLVDLDPQGNSTSSYGLLKRKVDKSVYDLIAGNCTPKETVHKTKYKCDIIPANIDFSGAGVELARMTGGEEPRLLLRQGLTPLLRDYDFIFIDCPPSLDLLTLNGLCACDTVMIPIQCEYFALEGLTELMNTVRLVKKSYNNYIDIEGIVLTMFDGRLNLNLQVLGEVKKHFGDKVYKTSIPRNVRLSEAPSFGAPVNYYDPASRGAAAYRELTAEFLSRNKA